MNSYEKSVTHKKTFNVNLEILRGFAALLVVFSHIIYHHKYFNSTYLPSGVENLPRPGHIAVLIFFILSGYVIGLNHKERLKGSNIFIYLKKRFLRIYPIYFLAILLGLLVAAVRYDLFTIIANFTLTQNISYPVIWENNPAWSLNYEILFYLLFLPISFFQINSILAFVIFLLTGIISIYLPINPIIPAYAFGYCFWLLGMYMSNSFKQSTYRIKIIPLIFYILAISVIVGEHESYVIRLFSLIRTPPVQHAKLWAQEIIGLSDLLLMPYAFMIVLIFAGKEFKYSKFIFIVMQLFPLYVIYSYYKKNIYDCDFYIGVICYVLASFTLFINIPEGQIKKFGIWLGSISYGIYIIHFPVLFVFGRFIFLPNNLWCYLLKIILYLFVVLLFSFLLERKFQPQIKKWFK